MSVNEINLYDFDKISNYLSAVLKERKSQNSSYSLRAFARDLGLSPTTTSHFLNSKIKITPKIMSQIVSSLKLPKKQERYFKLLATFEGTKSEDVRIELLSQLKTYSKVWTVVESAKSHQWNLLEHWFILPVLEFLPIIRKKTEIKEIAKRLNLKIEDVEMSIEALIQSGIVFENSEGQYLRTNKQIIFDSAQPDLGLQSFHRQMLMKARSALVEQDNHEKFVGSETFAVASENISEIKEILETCFQQVLAICQKPQNPTDVYHLGIQMFNLTSRKL